MSQAGSLGFVHAATQGVRASATKLSGGISSPISWKKKNRRAVPLTANAVYLSRASQMVCRPASGIFHDVRCHVEPSVVQK